MHPDRRSCGRHVGSPRSERGASVREITARVDVYDVLSRGSHCGDSPRTPVAARCESGGVTTVHPVRPAPPPGPDVDDEGRAPEPFRRRSPGPTCWPRCSPGPPRRSGRSPTCTTCRSGRAARCPGRTGSSPALRDRLEERGRARPVAPPGGRRAARPRRPARRGGDRDGVGEVAGLPTAGPDPARGGPPRLRALPGSDQGAGPRPARLGGRPGRSLGAPGRLRRGHPRRGARLGAAALAVDRDQPGHAPPRDPAGAPEVVRARCAGWPTSSSTSATPTAGCSAPTWGTCCAGSGGSAAATGPSRCSCWPRRPSPSPPPPRAGWWARRSRRSPHDGSPRPGATFALWEPPLTERTGEHGAPLRRSAAADAATLLADLVERGARTLAFVRSRRSAESVADQARRILHDRGRDDLVRRVDSYRGGYLPEERRELERALSAGRPARRRDDERAGARHRHRRAGRRRAGRLPGDARLAVAAGRPGGAGAEGVARRLRRPRRPAGPLPRPPPPGGLRPADRGHRHRPGQPLRPGPAAVLRGGRAAAGTCGPRRLRRAGRGGAARGARGRRSAPAAAGRLVLGRSRAARRRHPRQRRRAGVDHRGRDRPAARHGGRRRRALHRPRRRALRAPGRHVRRRRVRRRRRLRRGARREPRVDDRRPRRHRPRHRLDRAHPPPRRGHRAHRRARRDQPGRRLPAAPAGHRRGARRVPAGPARPGSCAPAACG